MGRFSTNFRTRARAGVVPTALLELTIGGIVYRFSDSSIASVSQGMYEPKITSWGSFGISVSDRTSRLESPDITVNISDMDGTLSNAFRGENARAVHGSSAIVRLAYEDLAFADWFKLFDGQIVAVSMPSPRVWAVTLRFNDAAVAAAVSEIYIQSVHDETFITAPDESLGTEIPIVYGKNTFPTGGILKCPKVSTDGDPSSSTKPHRYIVCTGFATSIEKIFADSDITSPVRNTDWFWTTRNGFAFTEVGFVADQTGTDGVAVNVWGLSTNGNGSETEGDLITNPAKQIEHLLTNFIFNRWKSGAYFSAASQPIDTASITTVATYFDKVRGSTVKKPGSNILRRQSALTALNDWAFQNQVAVHWNEDGELRFAIRTPFDTDIYLDNNTPANWPWFETDVHGRGNNSVYPLIEDDQQLVDRIVGRLNHIDNSGRFRDDRIVQDFNRTGGAEEEMQLKWGESDMDTLAATDFDVVSRRLRRSRFPIRRLTVTGSVAMLDPELLDGVLVSDPDAPNVSGTGWKKDNVWEPRLHTIVSQDINLNTKTVRALLEDERDYRCTLWATGRGEVSQDNRGRGMPILSQVTRTFTRATKAWVSNIDGMIVQLSNNIPKLTPSGWLFEAASDNWIQNPAFVAGLTNWGTTGTTALDTTVLLFQPKTAADLSGTNQTVKLSTVASVPGTLTQTTGQTFAANLKCSFSIYHRDNTGSPIRARIQNTSTLDWLKPDGTWDFIETDAANFADSGGVWARDSIKFQMQSTGSTLLIKVTSGSGTTEDNHVGHIQIEDALPFPTSVMVSGASATFSRNRDQNVYANSSPDRSFEWFAQGTFRCTYQPLFDAADLPSSGQQTICQALNSTPTDLLKMVYENSGGEFVLGWDAGGGAQGRVAVIAHDVVAGQVYKVVGRWIGSNGELGKSQGDLILDVYDPVGATWLTDEGSATQNAEVGTATFRVGDGIITPFSANGYIAEFEVLPFVLTTEEARAFP